MKDTQVTFTGFDDTIIDERIRKSPTAKVYLAMEMHDGSIIVIPEDCWGDDGMNPILENIDWECWVCIVAEHPKFVRERYMAAHDQWYNSENN
jgi:hypothetical protein